MKTLPFLRTCLVALFATVSALPTFGASAAIPCNELPVIEADPMMPVPMIYIELPVTVEAALARGGAADRTSANPVEDSASVRLAAENQFRCLGYGNDLIFVGNSTPQQRVHMSARPNIDAQDEQYIALESLNVLSFGEVMQLEEGRYLIDFEILVDGNNYLAGELVFADVEGQLYLDGSAIHDSAEMSNERVVVEISTRFTREVKIIEARNGDVVAFDNIDEEASADIVITNAEGETVFEGSAMAYGMDGGEDYNLFAIHNLEPGEYQVMVTFSPDDITYGATLVVSGDTSATPEASPES